MAKRGRPTKYTPKIADEIITRLSAGESLSSICSDEGMPAVPTVCDWNTQDRDGFSDKYARARLVGVLARLDAAHDSLADGSDKTYVDEGGNRRVDSGSVQLARAYADHVRWLASRLIPEMADKKQVEHSGHVGMDVLFAEAPEDDD